VLNFIKPGFWLRPPGQPVCLGGSPKRSIQPTFFDHHYHIIMNRIGSYIGIIAVVGLCGLTPASGQGLPKSQPKMITIIREEVKVGRNTDHSKFEAGWPAAMEKAKSPDFYLGMTSLTGPNEAWFVMPWESHAAVAESMKREDKDPVLSAELARLSLGDAEYISSARTIQGRARTELSVGEFPDVGKARFFEMTVWRVRSGHQQQFEEAAKAYGAARARSGSKAGYRVYEVIAGMPTPTYLTISSVESYGGFDQVMSADQETWKAMTADEKAVLQQAGAEALISSEQNKFKVDPQMSYVPKETRERDPEFWTAR
jgi:hypothetical protein